MNRQQEDNDYYYHAQENLLLRFMNDNNNIYDHVRPPFQDVDSDFYHNDYYHHHDDSNDIFRNDRSDGILMNVIRNTMNSLVIKCHHHRILRQLNPDDDASSSSLNTTTELLFMWTIYVIFSAFITCCVALTIISLLIVIVKEKKYHERKRKQQKQQRSNSLSFYYNNHMNQNPGSTMNPPPLPPSSRTMNRTESNESTYDENHHHHEEQHIIRQQRPLVVDDEDNNNHNCHHTPPRIMNNTVSHSTTTTVRKSQNWTSRSMTTSACAHYQNNNNNNKKTSRFHYYTKFFQIRNPFDIYLMCILLSNLFFGFFCMITCIVYIVSYTTTTTPTTTSIPLNDTDTLYNNDTTYNGTYDNNNNNSNNENHTYRYDMTQGWCRFQSFYRIFDITSNAWLLSVAIQQLFEVLLSVSGKIRRRVSHHLLTAAIVAENNDNNHNNDIDNNVIQATHDAAIPPTSPSSPNHGNGDGSKSSSPMPFLPTNNIQRYTLQIPTSAIMASPNGMNVPPSALCRQDVEGRMNDDDVNGSAQNSNNLHRPSFIYCSIPDDYYAYYPSCSYVYKQIIGIFVWSLFWSLLPMLPSLHWVPVSVTPSLNTDNTNNNNNNSSYDSSTQTNTMTHDFIMCLPSGADVSSISSQNDPGDDDNNATTTTTNEFNEIASNRYVFFYLVYLPGVALVPMIYMMYKIYKIMIRQKLCLQVDDTTRRLSYQYILMCSTFILIYLPAFLLLFVISSSKTTGTFGGRTSNWIFWVGGLLTHIIPFITIIITLYCKPSMKHIIIQLICFQRIDFFHSDRYSLPPTSSSNLAMTTLHPDDGSLYNHRLRTNGFDIPIEDQQLQPTILTYPEDQEQPQQPGIVSKTTYRHRIIEELDAYSSDDNMGDVLYDEDDTEIAVKVEDDDDNDTIIVRPSAEITNDSSLVEDGLFRISAGDSMTGTSSRSRLPSLTKHSIIECLTSSLTHRQLSNLDILGSSILNPNGYDDDDDCGISIDENGNYCTTATSATGSHYSSNSNHQL